MTPVDLFVAACRVDMSNNVREVNAPVARQAIELQQTLGGDLTDLFEPLSWFLPTLLLGLAFEGDALRRELRLHAVWCVRQVVGPCVRSREILIQAERVAEGLVTGDDRERLRQAWREEPFGSPIRLARQTLHVFPEYAATRAQDAAISHNVDDADALKKEKRRQAQRQRLFRIVANALQ